jgi:CheY-like chemotaxis protein
MIARVAKRRDDPANESDLQARLGVVIRTCRSRLGITQDELAWRSSLHRTYISGVERGARNVTLRSVASLAKALQVTVGNLFTYATASPKAHGSGAGSPRNMREIMLVEDNAEDAAMAARAFKRAKVTNPLRIVRSAEEGLVHLFGAGRHARRTQAMPQLILLDLNLPRISGMEFLRRVKGDPRTRGIPVVVLTITRTDSSIIECSRLGAEHYIVKPIAIENLVTVTPRLNLTLTLAPLSHDWAR